jgi:hypothetical protein
MEREKTHATRIVMVSVHSRRELGSKRRSRSPTDRGRIWIHRHRGVSCRAGVERNSASAGEQDALPNAGFQADLRPIDVSTGTDAFSHSFSVEGIRTFRGDGTGTVKGRSVGITVRPTPGSPTSPPPYPSFPPSAGSSDFSYDFKYTVSGDGSFTATMVPGSYTETFLTGPRSTQNPANSADQTATVDAIPCHRPDFPEWPDIDPRAHNHGGRNRDVLERRRLAADLSPLPGPDQAGGRHWTLRCRLDGYHHIAA